jgi:hypothetical protein
MFRITKAQMQWFQRDRLATVKREICELLIKKYPQHARPDDPAIEAFVRRAMEAARAVWIDEADQIARFVCAAFALEIIQADPLQVQHFTQVMISEQTAEARLLFVEENLVPK